MTLAAATAHIGVAAADLFPQVSFAGSFGVSATDLASFGGAPSLGFGFGPTIRWAAFDLGRVRARIRQADAEADAALSRYEQTVLLALEETANAFTGFAKARERAVRLRRAADDSALASELARARYEGGIESFLTVLDAERTRLAAEDQEAASDTEVMLNLVAIYRSIGGAWKAV
jgi:multidrug efflux system outer membrane protein